MKQTILGLTVLAGLAAGCSGTSDAPDAGAPDAGPEQQALTDVKAYIADNIADLLVASQQLQAAAPAPDADGWNATADAAAVDAMKTQWKRARTDYEHVEGAIAVLFPDLDDTTDNRYDAFLAEHDNQDTDLFDDQGVTGIHAIERILWSDSIPQKVVTFESQLPGYQAAAFPSNQTEADEFKNKLCQRMIDDVKLMQSQFAPLALDPAAAYRGVIGSMKEQLEKAQNAATGEEESRYAQYTLQDMRVNVQAGEETFAAFKPWLQSKNAQDQVDQITAAFSRVDAAYAKFPATQDALPPVPDDWSSSNPTQADLQTDFGQLWTALHHEADESTSGTLVFEMDASAQTLGIPELPQ